MNYIRYGFVAIVLILAVTVALANSQLVTLALWPDTVTAFTGFGYSVTLPLFVLVGGGVGLGLVLGLIWEWMRERAYRAELARLRRELATARAAQGAAQSQAVAVPGAGRTGRARKTPEDEVLAILDEDQARR
ncbi:MAG: DUF1049 domain-containing protein [Pararhodobacter sp.]|nr:DUF1049 domain-containing protein [Pararhodobacter sp.]